MDHKSDVEGLAEGGGALSFGKYQPFASLGRGGMADVFLTVARGPMGFNKLAVVKRLRQALAEEVSFRTMFLDEARLAARLNHPNIVHTYEVGEHHGAYFIAMEYLEGQALNKVIKEISKRRESIPPELCARIVSDALTGLHHAHELRDYDGRPLTVIHRDVSPHNIFVSYDGHTKLVDFGIAKAALSNTETEVGVLKGKVAYMSPEQASGGHIDARADIFPMGIVLWEMLTARRLMSGDSAAQTLHRLMNVEVPRVSSVIRDIDPMLDDIVARALQKDPAGRYQTAAHMRDALEAFITRSGMAARQDDVSRLMVRLFGRVRDEVQRQVQRHMATIAPANTTEELRHLTANALAQEQRMGGQMSNASDALLRLGGASGSGSGIISNYPPAFDSRHPPPQPAAGKSLVLVLFAAGFFVLALAIGAFVLVRLRPGPVEIAQQTSPTEQPQQVSQVTQPINLDPPQNTTVASGLAIAPPPPSSAHGVVDLSKVANGQHAPRTSHTSTGTTASAQPAQPPPPATASQDDPGFLTMVTYPWTHVTVAGKTLTTPFNKVALPPGTYNLVLENPDQGIRQTVPVTIKSGEVTSKNMSLK